MASVPTSMMRGPSGPGEGDSRRPPLGGVLGTVAAGFYRVGIAWKNRRFTAGRGVVTFDRPVISVGNLSVGGTGKTPLVLHLARVLTDAGHNPCVAMRGYGAPRGQGLSSDEAQVYRRAMRTLPIVAQPDRTFGLIEMFGSEQGQSIDCVILDDGFQHRKIARQLDIVLIDATRDPFQDRLLPAGFLREPVVSLRRARAVVITHAESAPRVEVSELEGRIRGLIPEGVICVCRHQWDGLAVVGEDGESEQAVNWLASKRVFVACAIGNPGPFLALAQQLAGGMLAGSLVLKDHAEYEPDVVARLVEALKAHRAGVLLVTEKDWSKLQKVPSETWPCPVVRPRLELRFDRGGEELAAAVLGCVKGFEDRGE